MCASVHSVHRGRQSEISPRAPTLPGPALDSPTSWRREKTQKLKNAKIDISNNIKLALRQSDEDRAGAYHGGRETKWDGSINYQLN